MKKRKLIPALFLLALLSLSACGSGAKYTGSNGADAGENFAPPQASFAPEEPSFDNAYEPGFAPEEDAGGSAGVYYENTKVILTAELSLQSTDFDAARDALEGLVTAQKGYFERAEYANGGYGSGSSRWGSFTIRVPKENFNAFLDAVGDVAHVTSRVTGVQDVGEEYYDAELHLKTLNTKHDRLLDLLEKAEIMEDIIALETALSDVEYQIQQYSSTLTRYDALIDYSTIRLDLQEVVRVTDTPTEVDPLSARLGAAFTGGWQNFCDGLAGFALWGAYHFIGLLSFILAAVLAVFLCRRLLRRRREKLALLRQSAPFSPPPPPEGKDGAGKREGP